MGFDLQPELEALEAQHLRRRLQVIDQVLPGGKVIVGGREFLNLSSNDYLGLALDPRLIAAAQAAAGRWGAGSTASRLITGTLALHQQVETEVADFKGTDRAIIFNTGYMANVGVISALMGKGDVILSDRLNHASIIDGMRLSEAGFYRYPHRDLNRLEDLLKKYCAVRRLLIVTDSVFSVDGDLAPLADLVRLKERYGAWLMIDEAHATGVLGATGAGLAEALGLSAGIEIHMGTFSKALGSFGAYVAGSAPLIDMLHNRARAFIYSTALPPPVLGAMQAALAIVRQEPEPRDYLLEQATLFRQRLQAAGLDTLESETQIIPVLVGDNRRSLEFAARLRQIGLMAVAIRPPTVAAGSARLRFSLSAAHQPADLARAAEQIIAAGREMGLNKRTCS
ncbi:8-amino-7-oxononanoate synthase [Desulfobacca acetoxidans]|uniref:8-amino-7-ketopelargonate synthase n=1 Tax=Desulfobacca acetoxidans (strain ATCC 700848 / DSM 11109 / ASRB2) TaxID=880072 RepID=F2NFZ5_DESAR|nr:8-amino-7-oxononanoate synthase [Desulfobacca acetoxidans]AEB08408.1 8-amino-7-oxononanoate synthase [Desulfobacca acetoxidans DSM 11109]